MINQDYCYKAQKYKEKYLQLKLLYGGLLDNKMLKINYTSMFSTNYSIKQHSQTTKDTQESHYESTQSFSVYSSIKDDLNINKDQFITNIENNMINNNTNISIEENNFDNDELVKYLKLAIKYNYQVNIIFSNESIMDKLIKKLGDKVNDPNEWLLQLDSYQF